MFTALLSFCRGGLPLRFLGVSVAELFEAPASGTASISCPHCGRPITLKVEP